MARSFDCSRFSLIKLVMAKLEVEMREYEIFPTRIILQNGVENAERCLEEKYSSVVFRNTETTVLRNDGGENAYLLLDFGKELQGGVRIITQNVKPNGIANVRFTFGESVGEALSSIGEKGATNEHSPRDFVYPVSFMLDNVIGQTGFRFLKIELMGENAMLEISSVSAILNIQSVEVGSFSSNDALLDKIVETAIYTLHLNLQNGMMWDGIKRDRAVWSGDTNPEILSLMYFFGNVPNIKNTLRFLRKSNPKGMWIEGISSYSMWWIINVCNYVLQSDDFLFCAEMRIEVLQELLRFESCYEENGKANFAKASSWEWCFLDWPTSESEDAETGVANLMLYALEKVRMTFHSDKEILDICEKIRKKAMRCTYPEPQYKQVMAMQTLVFGASERAKEFLESGGAKGLSTFMGYYILKALSICNSEKTLDILKEYYGGMLQKGATTFWEDFDIAWMENSGRIDEITPIEKKDVHGDFGRFCYQGYRHSLCHGWSCGVLAFLVEEVIGLKYDKETRAFTANPKPYGLKKFTVNLHTPRGKVRVCFDGINTECKTVK